MQYPKNAIEQRIFLRIIGNDDAPNPGRHYSGLVAANFQFAYYGVPDNTTFAFTSLSDLTDPLDSWVEGGFLERPELGAYQLGLPNEVFSNDGPVIISMQPNVGVPIVVTPKEIYISNVPFAARTMLRADCTADLLGATTFSTTLPTKAADYYARRSIVFGDTSTNLKYVARTITASLTNAGKTFITLDAALPVSTSAGDQFILV